MLIIINSFHSITAVFPHFCEFYKYKVEIEIHTDFRIPDKFFVPKFITYK